jgi:HAD superfamily hydrolase (TIGR01509 family)
MPMTYRFDMAGHVPLRAAIFDVDGVLVDSPHEQAWRETLDQLMEGPWAQLALDIRYEAGSLTAERYQRAVAGRSRLDGARGGLEAVGVPDPDDEHVRAYAEAKQSRLVELIEQGPPPVFDDAVTLLIGLREMGLAIATASASRNAGRLLAAIALPDGHPLRDALDADVSGLEAPGKPDPAIFIEAARRLGFSPEECFVVEDAPAGVVAARRGGMVCVGVDRRGVGDELRAMGADVVLDRLDRLQPAELLDRLEQRHGSRRGEDSVTS